MTPSPECAPEADTAPAEQAGQQAEIRVARRIRARLRDLADELRVRDKELLVQRDRARSDDRAFGLESQAREVRRIADRLDAILRGVR